MDVKSIIASVRDREGRARELIGEPGPGIDIYVIPSLPLSDSWALVPKTSAGAKFLSLLWPDPPRSAGALTEFKRECADWGLSFYVDWSNIVDQKVD